MDILALFYFVGLFLAAVASVVLMITLLIYEFVRWLKRIDRPIDDFFPSGSLRIRPEMEAPSR